MSFNFKLLTFGTVLLLLSSCNVYKQHIMLNTTLPNQAQVKEVTDAYLLKPFDVVEIKVYAHNGELIVDPDFSLRKDLGMGGGLEIAQPLYTVDAQGFLTLPMIDSVKVSELNCIEAEALLNTHYDKYYQNAFVKIKVANRRVVVLSTPLSTVVPLNNENMHLLEVLALSGVLNQDFKASKIRLVRGDLQNPEVQVIDLSTIEGMSKANLQVLPNDIIYVEPVTYPVRNALRDIAPALSLVTTLISLVVLVATLNK
jgi:polysaccharide biosynthesis/export protein